MPITPRMLLALAGLSVSAIAFSSSETHAQFGVRVDPTPLTGSVNQSLNTVNNSVARGLNQLSRSVNRGLGQVNTSVNRGLNAVNGYGYRYPAQVRYPSYSTSYRPPSLANRASTAARSSYYSPQSLTSPQTPQTGRLRLTDEQRAALQQHQAVVAQTQAGLGILPADSLMRLTEKQAGLQNAAQAAAFDAQIGEIIEWNYEGAAGSAQAVSESRFGTMQCRDFVQTLTIGDATQTAQATACRRGNGQWARAVY